MKKIYLLILSVVLLLGLVACEKETVMLQCDGKDCNHKVEVEVKKDETPNEEWVVFCQDCANQNVD